MDWNKRIRIKKQINNICKDQNQTKKLHSLKSKYDILIEIKIHLNLLNA